MTTVGLAQSRLISLLAESALAVERLAADEGGGALRRAKLVIELRLKLEEQVLLPALRALHLPSVAAVAQQVDMLRDLAAEAAEDEDAVSQRQSWATLARACKLHFDAVAALTLMALKSGRFDEARAMKEARAYQARWRSEMGQAGDIEDEEADPVGRPPR